MSDPAPMWWDTRREPVQLNLEIPIGPDSDSPKPPKVRRTCFIWFGAIILRILGLAVAAVTLAYGAWTFYQIPERLTLEGIVKVVAQGAFLIFIGGLSLLAELRTRWTMRGCLSTYILFANYLARGIIYVALGAIIWALEYYAPPIAIKQAWIAGGILAVGGLNIAFYPFYWKHERAVDISKAHSIPLEPYPEEIIYGMDTLYIKKHIQNQNTQPAMQSPATVYHSEGANEMSPPSKKGEKETPGEPEMIHIVVEPSVLPTNTSTSNTTSAATTTCAEELRHSTVIENTVPESIGVGAS